MLQAIVHFSLRFRGVVVTLAAMLLAYGFYVAAHAKLDVFPDFVPPEVTVQTEAPGLSPEQVETLVTRPVETAINGLGSQESMRSESIQGLSVITIVFKEGTRILEARQLLAEKLGETAGALPFGVKAPKMGPLVSATMDLLKIGLTSDKLSPMELRTFAQWTLQPRLLAVPGVAHCNIFGGEVRQWQVQVHPDQLVAHNLALTDVLAAARQASGVRGAGFIETPNQRVVLQSEGQMLTIEALGQIVVAVSPGGIPVRLRDIAAVTEGAEPKFGDALVMGKPGVLMTMSSQYGANTMDVTRALEGALEELKPVFVREGITFYPRLHRPATFIEASLRHIGQSLWLGAALVAVVLFLFLGHFRTAVISLLAIPLSLLGAIVVLDRLGVTLNTITLGGLAIALGEVVDDAIIDVENILRRLRENRLSAAPRPALDVILDASLEVRHAIVYATCIVALVFVPVLTLTGLQGSFFAPLARTYLLAIGTSLCVALTVTPALTLLLFPRGAKESAPPRLQAALRRGYEHLLGWVSGHAVVVIGTVALICLLALSRLPFLGGEFLPDFREGHFVLGVSTAPGASLAETLRIGRHISAELLKNPNIATVEQQVGRAEQGEDTWGPQQSEFHVELKPDLPGRVQAQVEDEIRAVLDNTPGIQSEVLTFLGDRIGESIGGETAPVVVNLFGEDLDALDTKAAEIAAALGTVPGAADVQLKAPPGAPRLSIRLRPDRVTDLGLRPVDVLETIQTAYEGEVVAQVYRGEQVSDIAVTLDPASHRDPEDVGSLALTSLTGVRVPLREVADVYLTNGRFSILHEGARRRQTITCQPTGRDVQSFVAEARDTLAKKVTLPAGMYLEFAGAAETQQAATRELLLHSAIAAVGILLLLSVVLGHWRNLLLVLINLPLALTGGVLAIYFNSLLGHAGASTLTMGALIGFVTLFGITTRNAIMLVSHYEHLVRSEGQPWGAATAIRGASERLVPILMTASVTALGLFPLALGSGEAGQEIEGPMAVVILGGLATSAVLNLLVLPTLALRFGHFEAKRD
ncbi:MAG TPA: efflux RND transporter permease subunit [Opitutaceae bacterium]|nr:efflux RND transporter permease subunit [Lacunisphaera sp.]HWA09080.1 efflux RND transporter permease subunit [Opitutaceae bacterium]